MQHVFVYGSLLRGLGNHRLLASARFVGLERTADAAFTMLDLGAFPGVVDGGGDAIRGELYEVDAATFAALDRLEGHPHFYARRQIKLQGTGPAWMYVLNDRHGVEQRVAQGDWRRHLRRRRKRPIEA